MWIGDQNSPSSKVQTGIQNVYAIILAVTPQLLNQFVQHGDRLYPGQLLIEWTQIIPWISTYFLSRKIHGSRWICETPKFTRAELRASASILQLTQPLLSTTSKIPKYRSNLKNCYQFQRNSQHFIHLAQYQHSFNASIFALRQIGLPSQRQRCPYSKVNGKKVTNLINGTSIHSV